MRSDQRLFRLASGLYSFIVLICLGGLALAYAQDQDPPTEVANDEIPPTALPSTAGGGRLGANYVIGPEDVLTLEVFNVPELRRTVRVSNDGKIVLPLLGAVKAAGLTSEQLRHELEAQYGATYLQNPQLSISVREFHSQPVSVLGAVERPGIYQLTGPRTLMEVISLAGGPAKNAGGTILVTRKGGFGALPLTEGMHLAAPGQLEVSLRRLISSREKALDIEIMPQDSIGVSRADIVYVIGEVKKPGGFVLNDRESVTVLQALAMAEGLNFSAAKGKGRIVRSGQGGIRTEIPVDIGKIMKGKAQDLKLAGNDILLVPGSASRQFGRRTADVGVYGLTGLVLYRHY